MKMIFFANDHRASNCVPVCRFVWCYRSYCRFNHNEIQMCVSNVCKLSRYMLGLFSCIWKRKWKTLDRAFKVSRHGNVFSPSRRLLNSKHVLMKITCKHFNVLLSVPLSTELRWQGSVISQPPRTKSFSCVWNSPPLFNRSVRKLSHMLDVGWFNPTLKPVV